MLAQAILDCAWLKTWSSGADRRGRGKEGYVETNNVVGTWKLAWWEARTSIGEVSHPYGLKPKGLLIYTEDGHMSVTIMRSNRPHLGIAIREFIGLRRHLLSKPWTLITAWRKLRGLLRYMMATANCLLCWWGVRLLLRLRYRSR